MRALLGTAHAHLFSDPLEGEALHDGEGALLRDRGAEAAHQDLVTPLQKVHLRARI